MARMIRKQIVIDAQREQLLERLAQERGLSQSELIRMAIDEMVAAEKTRDAAQRARMAAHERLVAFFEGGWEETTAADTCPRRWSREDYADDRGLR